METNSTSVSLASPLPAQRADLSVRVDIARAPTQDADAGPKDAPCAPVRCVEALALAMEHGASGF